jgi:hypothetical protein
MGNNGFVILVGSEFAVRGDLLADVLGAGCRAGDERRMSRS